MMRKLINTLIVILLAARCYCQEVPTSLFRIYFSKQDKEIVDRITFEFFDEDRLFEKKSELIIDSVELYIIKNNKDILLADFWYNQPIEKFFPLHIYYKKNRQELRGGLKAIVYYDRKAHIYITKPNEITAFEHQSSFLKGYISYHMDVPAKYISN